MATVTHKLRQDDELLDAPGLAAFLRVEKSWVYRMVEECGMPAVRIGRKYLRFEKGAVVAWINEQAAKK